MSQPSVSSQETFSLPTSHSGNMSTMALATSISGQISAAYEPPSLTTTFVPPPECTANHLTMMEDMQFSIFLNEPLPVPNTTITSCYPSQFGNSWLLSAAGTTLPAFSPLVCPQDYTTALNGTGGCEALSPAIMMFQREKSVS